VENVRPLSKCFERHFSARAQSTCIVSFLRGCTVREWRWR
jgi:hypothetical protein